MKKPYTSRAEKRQITRKALIDAATELLARNGIRATTLEAVAERAGLHVQTLYRHFSNKGELFAALEESLFLEQKALLEDPERQSSTLGVRYGMDVAGLGSLHEEGVKNALVSLTDPEWAGVHMLTSYRYEDLLSEHLARELGCKPNDPEPRLLAAMLQWGATSVLRSMDDATAGSEEAMLALYRRTFDLIAEVQDSFKQRVTEACAGT